ncbi:hypothetical protein SASPL_122271 [Salvia splendens]|uniref:WAT1-related protein n=1 Tax=Salvia splendens TaxID=180675 RepID=A0A8X8ZSA9_SALSN|nr:hypothetical protein SASPL_122271 [Salvia splendens]
MGNLYKMLDGLKPLIMMVTVQIALAGVNILYKLVANTGMSLPILIAYRFLFASATIAPLALILERSKTRPKLTWKILYQAFACGLFGGTLNQNLYAASLVVTSPTFIAAISNLIPGVTLVLGVIFRMEALGLKTWPGKAKVAGTFFSIGGAMLLTFYKGVELDFLSTKINFLHQRGDVAPTKQKAQNNVLGLVLGLGSCLSIYEHVETGVEHQTSNSCLHGCFCIRDNVCVDDAVYEDERTSLRVDFQPFATRARRHCRMLVSTGKVAFGKFAPESGGFVLNDCQEEDLEAKVSSTNIKT